jgi:hypothetical protein
MEMATLRFRLHGFDHIADILSQYKDRLKHTRFKFLDSKKGEEKFMNSSVSIE